jgi:hypothetical protein
LARSDHDPRSRGGPGTRRAREQNPFLNPQQTQDAGAAEVKPKSGHPT